MVLTYEQQRSIYLEYAVSPRLFKVNDICEKYELSKYRLAKIRHSQSGVVGTMQELVLTALYMNADNLENLASTCDYLNHALPTHSEINKALAELQAVGLCQKSADSWQPTKSRAELFLFVAP